MMSRRIINWMPFSFLVLIVIHCGLKPNPIFTNSASEEITIDNNYELYDANNRSLSDVEQRLLAEIKIYLGAPYRRGGTSQSGFDCSGLVTTVYRNTLNLKLPRKVRELYQYGRTVGPSDLLLGDLVFFERVENFGVSHVGIYIGELQFVHASSTSGVIISKMNDSYYRTRFVGAKRVYDLSSSSALLNTELK
jgi:cell wall-associated NlpC family hydrolase